MRRLEDLDRTRGIKPDLILSPANVAYGHNSRLRDCEVELESYRGEI
jgi:hypothetical protein